MIYVTAAVFWIVQASALLVFAVPVSVGLVLLWAASHFLRAIGLTLAFHRYFAHRAFKMNRIARFVWAFIGTAAMQKGPLWWAGHHVNHHRFADRDGDPHSPMVSGLYYAHIGWFLNDVKHDTLEATNWSSAISNSGDSVPQQLFLRAADARRGDDLVGGFPWLVWASATDGDAAHSTLAINTVNHLFDRDGSTRSTNRATTR